MECSRIDDMKKETMQEFAAVIEKARDEIFTNGEHHAMVEALGVMVSKFCEWDYEYIESVVKAALEDANFKGMSVEV